MSLDPFYNHQMNSNIFRNKITEEIKNSLNDIRIISDGVLYLEGNEELIIIDYFLTIRRKFTPNYYIYRKNELISNDKNLIINKVNIIYDYNHTRFSNNFDEDTTVNYNSFYYKDFYIQRNIAEMKKYDFIKIIFQERKKIKNYDYFDKYDLSELTEHIKSELYSKKISFILGAGISIDAGFPSWEKLLNELYLIAFKNIFSRDEDIQKFRNKYPDLLKQSKILNIIFEDELYREVHEIFYRKYRKSRNTETLANFVSNHNSTFAHNSRQKGTKKRW